MNYRRNRSGALLCAIALLTAFFVFRQPEASRNAAAQGLALCGGPLLLGIFPFLIVSNLIVSSGCAAALAFPFWPLARALGEPNKSGAVILLLGALGGFAPAAAAAAELCRRRELDGSSAALLLTAAAGSSPSFVILSVGKQMLGNTGLGVRLYLCQLAAAYSSVLVYRAVVRWLGQHKAAHSRTALPEAGFSDPAAVAAVSQPGSCLSAAIGDSSLTYIRLCGFVVYFRILAGALAALLPEKLAVLPAVLLEVSSGCSLAAQLPVSAVYGCCAALSLQSASVLLQIRAICPREISLRPLLLTRPLHLILSLGLLRLMLSGDRADTVYNSLEARIIPLPRLPLPAGLLLFALCLLLCDQLCRTLQTRKNEL